jgi:predicted transcriptional regulator
MAILTIPDALANRLKKASADVRRSPESLATEAVAKHLDYLEWRRKAIDEGFASGEREGWSTTEAVLERFTKKRRAALARKKTKAA